MRSDREGLEDTRCCDTKPETGIFSLLLCTVEAAGGKAFVIQTRSDAEDPWHCRRWNTIRGGIMPELSKTQSMQRHLKSVHSSKSNNSDESSANISYSGFNRNSNEQIPNEHIRMIECCSRPCTIPNINALCAATKKFQGQNNFLFLFHCLFFFFLLLNKDLKYNFFSFYFLRELQVDKAKEDPKESV